MFTTSVPDATTVILVRDGSEGVEVFMVLRAGGADFHGGASVFPGGRVDPADAELASRCAPIDERDRSRLAAEDLEPEQALACWVAAIRELFEEVGVLLASRDGEPLDFTTSEVVDRLGVAREALVAKRTTFAEIVDHEGLTLETDTLHYFSRYVTPPYAPKRFDTRFVIAAAPPDQLPTHDALEIVSGEWLTPQQAIGLYASRERQIVPPTLQNLFEIAKASSVAELVAMCRDKVIAPVCPSTVRIDGVVTLIYPGDRDHMPALEPGFLSQDPRPADLPILRFTAERDGRWGITPGVPRKGAVMSSTEERLHRLEAIAEIKELTARYCLHVARNEGDAIVDLFTDDGVLDGSSAGMGVISGREALSAFYRQAVTDGEESLPFIHNHVIVVDGDHASGTCALEARFSRSGRSVTAAGYYEDTYRREGGRWLLAERKLYFHHAVPLSAGWAESQVASE